MIRQAAEGGQLYGSVSPRDLAALVTENGFSVSRAQIALHAPIKTIGLHKVPIALHPEVEVTINVTVARNADEAQRIARGEDVTVAREEGAEAAEQDAQAAGSLFRAGSGRGAARTRGRNRAAGSGARAEGRSRLFLECVGCAEWRGWHRQRSAREGSPSRPPLRR